MMCQSLFLGTKIRKIFQNVICFYLWGKLSFECGASCLGDMFYVGRILLRQIQLCLMYCLILMKVWLYLSYAEMKKINPFAAQAETKKIPAIRNAKEEHFCDCDSKKKHI